MSDIDYFEIGGRYRNRRGWYEFTEKASLKHS